MVRRARLDAELVRRGLARSRQHAVDLVAEGKVTVGGMRASKVSTAVDPATPLHVASSVDSVVVSRGAHKLLGALRAWPELQVSARRCLDAGASTGGFTQVLLDHGAAQVVAVDVGYGQLAWQLQTDERVVVQDRTNVRDITPATIGGPVQLVVADLSFIALRLVLPALVACLQPGGDAVLMVKPQFEAGRDAVGSGGVVRDPGVRADAVMSVAERAAELGLGTVAVTASPLPGPAGNVEYFLWLRADAPAVDRAAVEAAVAAGPQ
ncbi:MAG: TlyA family RNA methyltransferase [Frankiaceae bacterium]|nr:TlyA family RNA methyltransferase [Frankiaceae bacterium]MBV9870555.1 TlyA family RNA methyltransferase [Frankiaceae bacterium]